MRRAFFGILLSATLSGLLISAVAAILCDPEGATHIVKGVCFSWANILFYSFITALFLAKKNIALATSLIVIKYLLLVIVVYYIWASLDVVFLLVGVFSELFLTALALPPFKRYLVS
jgi:hypothetical protein